MLQDIGVSKGDADRGLRCAREVWKARKLRSDLRKMKKRWNPLKSLGQITAPSLKIVMLNHLMVVTVAGSQFLVLVAFLSQWQSDLTFCLSHSTTQPLTASLGLQKGWRCSAGHLWLLGGLPGTH